MDCNPRNPTLPFPMGPRFRVHSTALHLQGRGNCGCLFSIKNSGMYEVVPPGNKLVGNFNRFLE